MSAFFKTAPFLLILGSCIIFSEIVFAVDLKLSEGFGDIAWETQAITLKDIKKIAATPDVSYYTRTENPYEIYGEDLGRVIYGFFHGRLYSAFLDIAGKEKFERTLGGLNGEFGPSRVQYRVGHDIYIWKIEHIVIKLKHFDGQHIHKLAFYYTPLHEKLNENQNISAEEMILNLP